MRNFSIKKYIKTQNNMKKLLILSLLFLSFSCSNSPEDAEISGKLTEVYVEGEGIQKVVLGPPTAECPGGQGPNYCCVDWGSMVICSRRSALNSGGLSARKVV